MPSSGPKRGLTLLKFVDAFLAVLTVVVGNGGQHTVIVIVGAIVFVISLLALTSRYVISTSRMVWLVVMILLVILIGYGVLFPAVPPVGNPAGM